MCKIYRLWMRGELAAGSQRRFGTGDFPSALAKTSSGGTKKVSMQQNPCYGLTDCSKKSVSVQEQPYGHTKKQLLLDYRFNQHLVYSLEKNNTLL